MKESSASNPWYASWFDSPYYHTLYKHRDFDEATEFVQTLISFLGLKKGSRVLDLACGKGRHAIQFYKAGFNVTGLDLSANSINEALNHETEGLNFYVHDMRQLYTSNYFDLVVNLFTSFGYFNHEHDNERVIQNAYYALRKNGVLVIDYFNSEYVKQNLIEHETKFIDGIEFKLNREIVGESVVKTISFTAENQDFNFNEKVKLYSMDKITSILEKNNLKIKKTFGDYHLNRFEREYSPRAILIASK